MEFSNPKPPSAFLSPVLIRAVNWKVCLIFGFLEDADSSFSLQWNLPAKLFATEDLVAVVGALNYEVKFLNSSVIFNLLFYIRRVGGVSTVFLRNQPTFLAKFVSIKLFTVSLLLFSNCRAW